MPNSHVDAIVGLYIECTLSTWGKNAPQRSLSHLSSHNMATGKTIKNLDVSIHAIGELTRFNSISVEKLYQHTANDPDLKLLIDHINNGFPDTSARCPECI